jgi:hypothetical protein
MQLVSASSGLDNGREESWSDFISERIFPLGVWFSSDSSNEVVLEARILKSTIPYLSLDQWVESLLV